MPGNGTVGRGTDEYYAVSHATRGTEQIGAPNSRCLADFDLDSLSRDSESRIRIVQFGNHALGFGQGRGVRATWHRTGTASSQSALYVLVRRGDLTLTDSTGSLSMGPEDIALVGPNSGPVSWVAADATELVCILVAPESAPAPHESAPPRKLTARSAMFRATYALLASATQAAPEADDAEIELLRDLTLDAVRALARASQPQLPDDDVAGRALEILEARLHSALFSIDDVARELQVSRRTLERAAALRGITLSDELSLLRTRHALSLLTDDPELSIAGVAAASGFGSAEVMRRAFRRHFHHSPAQLRRGLHASQPGALLD